MVEVCIVVTCFRRIGWPLDQVMNLAADVGLVQVKLNFFSAGNFFALWTARNVFALLLRHADGQQTVAGIHASSRRCRTRLDRFGDYPL